ncbi:hypothetical protein EDD16DRAFT_1641462 [Pisolithus croceorrhizus]|nr:hypothetical protein EDD16DRAFT_1641462 [Pisolithus croceorrhizus]
MMLFMVRSNALGVVVVVLPLIGVSVFKVCFAHFLWMGDSSIRKHAFSLNCLKLPQLPEIIQLAITNEPYG